MFKKDKLQIIPFKTYGTQEYLNVRGRALEDEEIDLSKKGLWNVIKNTWKRFETDEIRNTPLVVKLQNNRTIPVTTDAEGYYLLDTKTSNLEQYISEDGWLHYSIGYENPAIFKNEIFGENSFSGKMLVAPPASEYGVISDIDDTILHTGVASTLKWKAVFNTFFKNVSHRKALEGTATFYNKLQKGKLNNNCNPIFYVSNSPWNLYEYLDCFLAENKFPNGAILLRDLRHLFDKTQKPSVPHKYSEIQNILDMYPSLSFILIGDCGEHDPDIYIDMVAKNPNRILTVYLRSVADKRKMDRIKNIFKTYTAVDVLLVDTTSEAVAHAKGKGFI